MSSCFINRTALKFVAVIVLGLTVSCGDDDKPVKPAPAKEYCVYFADKMSPNTFFRYHTGSMELDSFHLPYHSGEDGFGISPDGKTMYLHPDMGIAEVSLDSLTVIAEHAVDISKGPLVDPGHQVMVSPDGQYLVVILPYLHVVRLADYSVVYADTQAIYLTGSFTADSRSFLTPRLGISTPVVREISLIDPVDVRDHDFGVYPWQVVVTSDDSQWFVRMILSTCVSSFRVHAMPSESLLFNLDMNPGGGDMAITPDNRYVIYTQHGPASQSCCPSRRAFIFYDILARQISHEVSTIVDSLPMFMTVIEDFCLTPNGRYLLSIGESGDLLQYDLERNEFKKYLIMEGLHSLRILVCQSKP